MSGLTLRQKIQAAISDLRIKQTNVNADRDTAMKLDHTAHVVVCTAIIKEIGSQIQVLEDIL